MAALDDARVGRGKGGAKKPDEQIGHAALHRRRVHSRRRRHRPDLLARELTILTNLIMNPNIDPLEKDNHAFEDRMIDAGQQPTNYVEESKGGVAMKSGIECISEERNRQVEIKGWSSDHDDGHASGDLAVMAAMCACNGTDARVEDPLERDWGIEKRHGYSGEHPDRIHLLAIAGALIAAEIDRLNRAQAR